MSIAGEHHRAPLLWLLLPYLLGLLLAPLCPPEVDRALAVVAVAVALGGAWVAMGGGPTRLAPWAACVCASAFAGGVVRMHTELVEVPRWRALPAREARLELEVTRAFEPSAETGRQSCLARVVDAPGLIDDVVGQLVYLAVALPEAQREAGLLRTTRLRTRGVLTPLEEPADAAPGFDDFLRLSGVRFRLARAEIEAVSRPPGRAARVFDAIGARMEAILRRGLPRDHPATAAYVAMFLGKKSELSDAQRLGFVRSGTMHLFAISGLHIGVIAVGLLSLGTALRLPGRWAAVVGLPMLFVFVEASGGSPSARRAFLMVAFMAAGLVLRRPANLVAALAASALAVLVWDPMAVRSASFQLSYAVMAALLLYGSPLRNFLLERWNPWQTLPEADWRHWQRAVFDTGRGAITLIAISLSATMVAAPLGIAYFGLASPGSLLTNLAVVPISGLAITAGLASILCGLAGLGALSTVFNHGGAVVIAAIDACAQWSSAIPGMWFEGHFGHPWVAPALTLGLIGLFGAGYALRWRRWPAAFLVPPLALTVLLFFLVTPLPAPEESATMKSAYELAMERLRQSGHDDAPSLSDEQKARLAEIDRVYRGRMAEREIFLKQRLGEAEAGGQQEEAAKIRRQMADERARLEEEREDEKNKVRRPGGR